MRVAYQPALLSGLDDSDWDAVPYLRELGIELIDARRRIQFNSNMRAPVHRWSPYVQGFSAEFVYSVLKKYWETYQLDKRDDALVYDPFAGVGTVLVEARKRGVRCSMGTELNPLLAFLANTKLQTWQVPPEKVLRAWESLDRTAWFPAPRFLESDRHFRPEVLTNLQILRGAIEKIPCQDVQDIFKVAFASILIDCSNLKRTPCLGYWSGKVVAPNAPWTLMEAKVGQIAEDLEVLQAEYKSRYANSILAQVCIADAKDLVPPPLALVITSPPYMNGLDYVMNYKIEMGWLGFLDSHWQAREIKNRMVACDNISPKVTAEFARQPGRYSDPWLTHILERISYNIEHWAEGHAQKRIPRRRKSPPRTKAGGRRYRRGDMPLIVHKYFDDMYQVMAKLTRALLPGGRIILVLGDSFIADVYVPTDLITAKMGLALGLQVESVEKVRTRRSGQIRSYKLRESVVTLVKPA